MDPPTRAPGGPSRREEVHDVGAPLPLDACPSLEGARDLFSRSAPALEPEAMLALDLDVRHGATIE